MAQRLWLRTVNEAYFLRMSGNSHSRGALTRWRISATQTAAEFKRIVAAVGFLVLLGFAQAQAATEEAKTNSPAEYFPIDLSPFITTVFSNAPPGNVWSLLPRGQQTLQGVPFKVDGKFEVTGMDSLKGNNESGRGRVAGIPLGRKADKVVLLHGTGWTEKDATPMAKVVLHYANGQERSFRIAYGIHLRNWYEDRSEKKKGIADPNSTVAWNGGDEESERSVAFRLYKTIFQNPLPGEVIQSVDFVSLFSHATPIIVGLTLQNGGPEFKSVNSTAFIRLFKKALSEPDSVYTATMKIRAMASDSGAVLSNSTLFVTLNDDQNSYSLGAYTADGRGTLSFDYPPHQTLSLNLLVKVPNRAPLFLIPERRRDGSFPAEIAAKLEPGATIGGMVKDDAGKPVAGAEVLISSVSRAKSRVYTQLDYDLVHSDSTGHWQSASLPHSFSNLVLRLEHPEYKPISYQQPGPATNTASSGSFAERLGALVETLPPPGAPQQPLPNNLQKRVAARLPNAAKNAKAVPARPPVETKVNIVSTEDLVANKAVLTMQHGLLVQGTVRGNTNQPLANAEVYFFDNLNLPKTKRLVRTKADGRFSFVANSDSGEAAVAVIAKGFAPRYEAFFLEPALKPFELALNAGSAVKAKVIDMEQKPVIDATVKLEQWHNTQILNWQIQTDADGKFSWTSAPEGPLTFSITKSNYFNIRTSMAASSGETTMTMRKMSNLSGAVVDAETKQPIPEFTILKGHSYSPGEPIRWNRYSGSMSKGRNGHYSVRLEDYYNGQSKIMIEAPGYMPVLSAAFTKPGWYTNDFALEKGKGIAGTIMLTNGEPVANCGVVLVDPGNSASLDPNSEFRANYGNADFVRTDAQGHFEFPPKAEVQTLMAAHDKGFVQIQTDKLPADGKIALQQWGHIKGVVKVGPKMEPGQLVVLQSLYRRYGEEGRQGPALSLYLRGTTDAQGHFTFNKVPPGDRTVGLYYELRRMSGSSSYTTSSSGHAVPITVKAGETNEVPVGGTGRTITGRIAVVGADQNEVDWKRDFHTINLRVPGNPELEPVTMTGINTEEERQKFWQERNERMKAFWRTEKGRELELKQRSYVLQFETNGSFYAYNIPPGTYDMYVHPTDPTDENDSYRQIGSLSKQFAVPDGPADQPFDTGSHDLAIKKPLRIGQSAPKFEAKTLDGKTINLTNYLGKYVLLNFTAKYLGPQQTTEIQTLKSLYDSYGKDGKLAIISLSLDNEEKLAKDSVTENGIAWPVCHLGNWGMTQVPARFGVDGVPHSILISPTGTIVNKSMAGTYMKTAVRNALESKTASARKL